VGGWGWLVVEVVWVRVSEWWVVNVKWYARGGYYDHISIKYKIDMFVILTHSLSNKMGVW